AARIPALDDPVLRLPEGEAVVEAVGGEDDEVVDRDRRDLRSQVDDDVAVTGRDRRLKLLLRGDAHRLRTDEFMRSDLRRGRTVGQGRRNRRSECLAYQRRCAGDAPD